MLYDLKQRHEEQGYVQDEFPWPYAKWIIVNVVIDADE